MKIILLVIPFIFSNIVLAREINIQDKGGNKITAYLQVPAQTKKFSALLVLQGSDCSSVHGKKIISIFEKLGIARLDIEKPGITKLVGQDQCPPEYINRNSIDQRVTDVIAVLNFLEKNSSWNKKVFILGGSEGATVGSLVASVDSRVHAIALLAGASSMNMMDEFKLLYKKGVNICNVKDLSSLNKKFAEILNNPTSDKNWCGKTNTYKWWSEVLTFNPKQTLLNLKIPIFAAHGTEDKMVPIESSDLMNQSFKEQNKKNFTYYRYQDLNHHWQDRDGVNKFENVFKDLVKWLIPIVK